jgi:hypothetical protein
MISLTRMIHGPKFDNLYGIFGQLKMSSKNGGVLTLYTHEKPWIQTSEFPYGKIQDSCIPPGQYDIKEEAFALFGSTKQLVLVNESQNVFAHAYDRPKANQRYGSLIVGSSPLTKPCGCIMLGTELAHKNSERTVASPDYALSLFKQFLQDNPEERTIAISWANK